MHLLVVLASLLALGARAALPTAVTDLSCVATATSVVATWTSPAPGNRVYSSLGDNVHTTSDSYTYDTGALDDGWVLTLWVAAENPEGTSANSSCVTTEPLLWTGVALADRQTVFAAADILPANLFYSFAIGDLDGDGDTDAFYGTDDTLVRFERNDATGLLEALSDTGITVPSGWTYRVPTFADLDDDGDLDVLIGSRESYLYATNDGTGSFTTETPMTDPFGGGITCTFCAFAAVDMDDDGDQDLLYGNFASVLLWENDLYTGPGNITNPYEDLLLDYPQPAACDGDGDGVIEYMYGDAGTEGITILTGTAGLLDGLQSDARYDGIACVPDEGVMLGTSTGFDWYLWARRPDALTAAPAVSAEAGFVNVSWAAPADNGAEITLYTVTSSGGLVATSTTDTWAALPAVSPAETFTVVATNAEGSSDASASSAAAEALAAVEVPAAVTDLVCAPSDASITVRWAHEGGSVVAFDVAMSSGVVTEVDWTQRSADILYLDNHVEYTAIVTATNAVGASANATCSATPSVARAFIDVGTGDWLPAETTVAFAPVTVGDLDADGDLDMVVGSQLGLGILENIGSNDAPEFADMTASITYDFAPISTISYIKPDLVDFDDDGDLDLLFSGAGASSPTIIRNTGSAFFPAYDEGVGISLPFVGSFDDPFTWTQCNNADLDADGDPDVVCGCQSGELYLMTNDGTGSFTFVDKAAGPFNWAMGEQYHSPAFCDWDSDGDLDMIDGTLDALRVSENLGSATSPYFELPVVDASILDMTAAMPGGASSSDHHPECVANFAGASLGLFIDSSVSTAWLEFAGVPDDIPSVGVAAGHGSALLWWDAPTENGSPVTQYTIESSPYVGTRYAEGTSLEFTGLIADLEFSFFVSADSGAGSTAATESDGSIVPLDTPSEPQDLACTATDGEISLSWSEPDFVVSSIDHYLVTFGSTAITTEALSVTVDGLDAWTAYNVSVAAVAAEGFGANATCEAQRLVEYTTGIEADRDSLFRGGFNVTGERLAPTLFDLDLDGYDDLIVSYGSSLGFFRFDPTDGKFVADASVPLPDSDLTYQRVTFGDVDQDGDLDALVGGSAAFEFYSGDGAGGFQPGSNAITDECSSHCAPLLFDLDSDGDLDAIIGTGIGIKAFERTSSTWTELTGTDNPFDDFTLAAKATPTLCQDTMTWYSGAADASGTTYFDLVSDAEPWADYTAAACGPSYVLVGSVGSLQRFELAAHADGVPASSIRVSAESGFYNVSWTAARDFGAAITAYTVAELGVATANTWIALPDPDLAFGTVGISASNVVGDSLTAAQSPVFGEWRNATAAPSPPASVSCTAGDYSITVEWAYEGGSATSFLVDDSVEVDWSASEATVTGLANYESHTVSVRAVNSVGQSAAVTCTATPFVVRSLSDSDLGGGPVLPNLTSVYTRVRPARALDQHVIAIGSNSYSGLRFFNASTGEETAHWYTGLGSRCSPLMADVTGDGRSDLLVGTSDSSVWLFEWPYDEDTEGQDLGVEVAGSAAPGIYDSDLVVGGSGELTVFSFSASSTSSSSSPLSLRRVQHGSGPFPYTLPDDSLDPTFCDVDGDGDLDVMVGYSEGGIVQDASLDCHADGLLIGGREGELLWRPISGRAADVTGVLVASYDDDSSTATVVWDAPVDTGLDVTQYVVTEVESGESVTVTGSPPPTSVAFPSVAFSSSLDFVVVASNAVGSSATTTTAALASVACVATALDGAILVSWDLPAYLRPDVQAIWVGSESASTGDSYTVLTPTCASHAFAVTFELVDGSPIESSTEGVVPLGVCPLVCADVANNESWIDPTGLDPFAVQCLGNYTLLSSADTWARKQAVAALSTETLFTRSDSAASLLADAPPLFGGSNETLVDVTASDGSTAAGVALVVSSGSQLGMGGYLLGEAALGDWALGATNVVAAVGTALVNITVTDQPAAEASSVVDLQTDVAFTVEPEAASVEVRVDGAPDWTPWANASYDPTEGLHTLEARAVLPIWPFVSDSVVEVGWTHDFTPPSATFADRPAEYSNVNDAYFSLAASEDLVTFYFCVDDACASETTLATVGTLPETTVTFTSQPTVSFASDAAMNEFSLDSGAWTLVGSSVTVDDPGEGWHSAQMRAVADDGSGAVDDTPEAFGFEVTSVDTTEPDTFFSSQPSLVTDSASARFVVNASEANCTLEYSLDLGSSWAPLANGGELVLEDLGDGHYSLLARATDAAGNVDPTPATLLWQVVAAPVASLVLQPLDVSPFAMSVFAVRVTGGSACSAPYSVTREGDGAVVEEGVASDVIVVGPLDYGTYLFSTTPECEQAANALSLEWEVTAEPTSVAYTIAVDEGEHRATLTATDAAGNTGPQIAYNWTLDVTPPTMAWASGDPPAALLASTEVDLDVVCVDSSPCVYSVLVDGVSVASVALSGLSQGSHEVWVDATDLAGNLAAEPLTASFVVDTLPPDVVISVPFGLLAPLPVVEAECSDVSNCTLSWELDGAPAEDGTVAGVADGDHNVTVTATDGAGNAVSQVISVVVDTVPPTASIDSAPAAVVNESSVTLEVSCFDLNGCELSTNGSRVELAGLDDGSHNFSVTATDGAGNVGSAVTASWEVDTVAPLTAFLSLEYSAAGDAAAYALGCDEDACAFRVDGAWLVNGSTAGTYESPADGEYTVCAQSVDPAGNLGPTECADLLFDTVPPVVAVTATSDYLVAPGTDSVSFSFEVTEVNPVSVACALIYTGAGAWTAVDDCYAPVAVGPEVVDALVTLRIVCVDARGHSGSANATWLVDRVAPEVSLDWAAALTNAPQWEVGFAVSDTSAVATRCELALDGAVIEVEDPCASPWTVSPGNGDATYALAVRATDEAGNEGHANVSTTLDTTPPVVEIVDQPPSVSSLTTATIEFQCVSQATLCEGDEVTTDPDCVFSYSVDGGDYSSPSSTTYVALSGLEANAAHEVVVVATDSAGNDAEATVQWTITTEAVYASFEAVPADPFGLATFEVVMSAPVAAATLQWRLNTGAWSSDGVEALSDGAEAQTWAAVNVTMPAEAGEQLLEIRVEGFSDATTAYSWTTGECARKDEVQFIGADGLLVCKGCRSGDSGCATNGQLEEGYWLPFETFTSPYQCFRLTACPGWDACDRGQCYGDSYCAEGYEGPLCSICAEGYADTFGGCQPCPESESGSVALVVCVFAVLVALLCLVLKYSKTIVRGSGFKVLLNFVHMVSAIVAFDASWPSTMVSVIDIMGVVNIDFESVTAAGCTSFPVGFYASWLITIIIPATITLGVWTRYWVRRGASNKTAAQRNSLLVLLFLYPGVSGVLIQFFSCMDVEGTYYLISDFSEECFSSTWYSWLVVAIVLTPLFVLGVPSTMMYLLYKARATLKEDETVRSLGLLYRSYRLEYYYHEVINLCYKTLLWLIAVLLTRGVVTQLLLALILTVAMLVHHALSWPYNHYEKNVLQLLNYLTAATMCIGGIIMRVSDTGSVPESELETLRAWLDATIVTQVVVLLGATLLVKVLIRRKTRRGKRLSSTSSTSSDPDISTLSLSIEMQSSAPSAAPRRSSLATQSMLPPNSRRRDATLGSVSEAPPVLPPTPGATGVVQVENPLNTASRER